MFKYSFRSKLGMTLAELLVVFTIMGVVAGMTIATARPSDKSYKYIYTRVINAVANAYYNASTNLPQYIANHDSDPNNADTRYLHREFPTSGQVLCKMLLEYINDTTGGVDANGNTAACPHGPDNPLLNVNDAVYLGSDVEKSAEKLDAALNARVPDFVSSNGVKFWIANAGTTTEGGKTYQYSTLSIPRKNLNDTGTSLVAATGNIPVRYYIIIADLNGKMRPNTTYSFHSQLADRVAFVLTDNADVVPLGRPEIDKRYLSAKVAYSTAQGAEEADVDTSVGMTFYEAKRQAWGISNFGSNTNTGSYPHPDEVYSLNFYGTTGGITSVRSPFYIDYGITTQYGINNFFPVATKNMRYDAEHCVKPNSSGTPTYDPDACYVRIDDFS